MKRILAVFLCVACALGLAGCSKVDDSYGVSSESDTVKDEVKLNYDEDIKIMSLDQIMPIYLDISKFDEEDYSDVYLGDGFEITAKYDGKKIPVPAKIGEIEALGFTMNNNVYDDNSLILPGRVAEFTLSSKSGAKMTAQCYNSSNKSVKFSECNITKFRIENNFYKNSNEYSAFDINGITNKMAITDVIDTLGTPSHFHAHSVSNYYLDYFISKDDRRNGITVCINPTDDSITAVEFSFYK